YFISTHGARKGLADTALKTADAGYLTRRLVDVAQNAIISEIDCGTIRGLEVSALKEGQNVVESLAERIQGRVVAEDVYDTVSEDTILAHAGEELSNEVALKIEKHGIMSVKIRSVLTCDTAKGICQKCYGRNLATSKTVTIGEPVGIIAAQSIGEPGTQLTLRTFHIGGAASTEIDIAEVSSSYDGIVRFEKMNQITNRQDDVINISHHGRLKVLDPEDNSIVLEEFKVEYAATLLVKNGQEVVKDTKLFTWDHYNSPVLATEKGQIKLVNFVKDTTYKEEFNDLTGSRDITIIDPKDKTLQPQISVMSDKKVMEQIPLQAGMNITVKDGDIIYPGTILGKTSRVTVKQHDITGGLPRVQELFEARIPKEKAIISEIDGKVTIGDYTKSGRIIFVESEDSVSEKKYVIPPGKRIIVHQGDIVESGDALSDGPLDPHDILRAKGIIEAMKLILNEIQEIYRKQGVKIDDKHIGTIIRQMLRKVKIVDPGTTYFLEGEIVDKTVVDAENNRVTDDGATPATYEQLLLGITKASLLTESWLSAASFQETTKVLTQAAIEGKIDKLEGLKECIILGQRIPVGTGTKEFNRMINSRLSEGKTIKEIVNELVFADSSEELAELLDY
ncbi:MAG: DNA-directed RNA polymerase subunit beta', partial [Candidatus Cloacimonetes bacterium]|nr:DNA-directed RNA polymerase subunit beta' [Candidatus Cloacimonadota bacterium]